MILQVAFSRPDVREALPNWLATEQALWELPPRPALDEPAIPNHQCGLSEGLTN